jgi:RNA methyltransferase, TrmH family
MFQPLSLSKLKTFNQIHEKRYRKTNQLFLIEGMRLFEESMKANCHPAWIVTTDEFLKAHSALRQFLKHFHIDKTFIASEAQVIQLCDTEQPQGIVAAMPYELTSVDDIFSDNLPSPIIALDRIADPGNVGTICRCADWFGVRRVVMNPSCVEWHNPKAVRSTMGSVFRVKGFENVNLAEFLAEINRRGYSTYAATVDPLSPSEFTNPTQKSVIVVGSEAQGLHEDILNVCQYRIHIPRYGEAESLNAAMACAILLNDLSKLIFNRPSL